MHCNDCFLSTLEYKLNGGTAVRILCEIANKIGLQSIDETFFLNIRSYLTTHFFDWLITAIITFITVRSATQRYYNENKVEISKNAMEQGLRALLKLRYDEILPSSTQVIFVEYKGRYWGIKEKNKCSFFNKIRKTITTVGGNPMRVSPYRPLNYGVLGVANHLNLPIVFDFQNGKLSIFDRGNIRAIEVKDQDEKYYYETTDKKMMYLSDKKTSRDIMIAIPISSHGKQVGGLTFDLAVGSKTLYQKEDTSDTSETREAKTENNIKVFEESLRTAHSLLRTYFNKMENSK